jgi:hypothetical protein
MLDHDNPQVDERIWQAWVDKNNLRDKARQRRNRVFGLISVFALLMALLWRFIG